MYVRIDLCDNGVMADNDELLWHNRITGEVIRVIGTTVGETAFYIDESGLVAELGLSDFQRKYAPVDCDIRPLLPPPAQKPPTVSGWKYAPVAQIAPRRLVESEDPFMPPLAVIDFDDRDE